MESLVKNCGGDGDWNLENMCTPLIKACVRQRPGKTIRACARVCGSQPINTSSPHKS